MTDLAPPIVAPQSLETLTAHLPHILDAPKTGGRLDLIVARPAPGERQTPERIRLDSAGGLPGDHWITGSGYAAPDGTGDPDAAICMMMSRVIGAIAGPDPATWPPAGDNLFLDMDLTPANMPPGTPFTIGSAAFVVTDLLHAGCQKFIDRYGRDACLFVNTGQGKELHLRGIYARVTQDGQIACGDTVRKLSA